MNVKLIGKHEKDPRACRDAMALTLKELMDQDPSICYVDCDLMGCVNTKMLRQNYPDRAFEAGIAEGNAAGVAAGLAATGKKVFLHSFGTFASRRIYDQIYMSAAYAGLTVHVLGSDPGVSAAFNGGTHMPFEDIALYRAVPGATVIDVADAKAFEAALWMCKDNPGVNYIRTGRKNNISVYGEGTEFKVGKANVLRDGKDCVIVACGLMVAEALGAAKILEAEGIDVAVIDPVTIKPLDGETILAYAKKCGCVVTAENANIIGGLGAAVSEFLGENCPTLIKRVGVNDEFGEVGDEAYLRERFGLTKENLAEKVREIVKKK